MKRIHLISILALLTTVFILTSCALATPPPAPVIHTLPPATTETEPAAIELVSSTATPESQSDGSILFRDDFIGVLGEGWTWMLEYPNAWSLTAVPHTLQIMAGSGYVGSANMTNVLVRPVPEGNFEVETLLTFEPQMDFQFAGLLIYESDSHFIQAGREFCSTNSICNGDGLYFDYYNVDKFERGNFDHQYAGGESVYVQIRREGQNYTFLASPNGLVWQKIGTREIEINPRYIGLLAGQNPRQSIPANFDFFEVRSVP